MSRRVYLLGVGLVLVALALAITDWALGPRPEAIEANVRRIRLGMTLQEVEALLGHPRRHSPELGHYWWGNWQSGCAIVEFDVQTGRATGAEFISRHTQLGRITLLELGVSPEPPSPLARLRAWLGW